MNRKDEKDKEKRGSMNDIAAPSAPNVADRIRQAARMIVTANSAYRAPLRFYERLFVEQESAAQRCVVEPPAVPVDKRDRDWLSSLEDITAGIATAVYGPGNGALWGLSAARVHGALPRALSVGYAFGAAQHRPIELTARTGRIEFRKRDPQRLDLEFLDTELGPGLVTSVAQTILDLSSRDFHNDFDARSEAVRNLMSLVDNDELTELADRVRGRTALARARRLVIDAD